MESTALVLGLFGIGYRVNDSSVQVPSAARPAVENRGISVSRHVFLAAHFGAISKQNKVRTTAKCHFLKNIKEPSQFCKNY